MNSLLLLIDTILQLYSWAIILVALLSWLVAFGVVNPSNRFVYMVSNFLYRITEPLLAPIRRLLPQMGGIDLSPIVLLLGIVFARNLLAEYWPR